jgi:OOP family OmpA-OmpF porin
MVRSSISENFLRWLRSARQTLNLTFSRPGLEWRLESLRTGKSFSEIVMLRSLVYRVEQVFLIEHGKGMLLLHVAAGGKTNQDANMVAGMLTAIQSFARDSFKADEDERVEEFRVGDLQIWIAPGRYADLAAVVRGTPPPELRAALEEARDSIHVLQSMAFANYDDDPSVFESARPILEACLLSEYKMP